MRSAHVLWNVVGLGLPLLMAVFAIPGLLALIGPERFGFLSLAWGLIGYAGVMDLGIGRATTQRVSELRNTAQAHQIPDVVATAIRITIASGAVGMLLILIATMSGAHLLIDADTVPPAEIGISMLLLAITLPMQAISATYRGINEAHLNFKEINILRIFLGVANFGAPYLVAIYTQKIYWLVTTLVFSRFMALVIYRYLAHRCMKAENHIEVGQYIKSHAQKLLKIGGWLTISGIVGPIMVQADRFFVGGLISAAAVTLYVIPYEVVIQTLIIVGAVTTVIYPVLTNLRQRSPAQANTVFRLWLFRIGSGMMLMTVALACAMSSLLNFWVGDHITQQSVQVGQILCIGVFLNAIGAMYLSNLHAMGKIKETSVLHIIEFPIYIILLVSLINWLGIIGCAIAWVLRSAIDTAALIWLSNRKVVE